jgi:predicted nucleic acid-binding protein
MFLDTSGLMCILDLDDNLRERAIELIQSSHGQLTHNLILAELIALGNSRRINRTKMLTFIEDLLANPMIATAWVDETLTQKALQLLNHRPDKNYSLCGAVSFVLMRDNGLTEALTKDRHFEQEGFVRLLKSMP